MDTNLYLGLQKGRVYKDQVAEYFRGMGFSVWQLTGYHVPIDMCVWNNQVDLTVKVRFRTYQSWDYPLTSWKFDKQIDPDESMPGGTKHLFFSIHPKNIRVMIFTKDMEFTDVWTMTQELCKTYTEVTHYLFEQNTLLNRGGLI